MPYNLSGIAQNITSPVDLAQGINTQLMHGYQGIIWLVIIWAIAFISFTASTNKPIKSMAASSFIAFGFSIMLYIIELVPEIAIFITLLATSMSLAFSNLE